MSEAEIRGLSLGGVRDALRDLAGRLGVSPTAIGLARVDEATWRDASLGCPEPGRAYAQVLTPGLWLMLSHSGQTFDYRLGGGGTVLCDLEQRQEPLERRPLVGLWSSLATVPTARSEVAAAQVAGKLYLFGGFGTGANASEEYDPETDTWRQRAPIPVGVNHTAAVVLDGTIYLVGGFDVQFRELSIVLAYDPGKDTWTRKADLPAPRGALGAAVVDGKIYAVGGRGRLGVVGTVEEYDPASDSWRARSPMPTRRDHIALSEVDGRTYVSGGRLSTFARNLDAHEVYDPRTDRWSTLAALPTPRSGIASAVVDGAIYVFGGESREGTFDTSEVYDPASDTWRASPPMPTARHGMAAVAQGNRIYVLAGGPTPGGSRSDRNEVFIVLEQGDEGR